jgi:hypothetical protein
MRFSLLVGLILLLAQEPGPPLPTFEAPSGELLQGRIVLFNWMLQWHSGEGDFVVRVVEKNGERRYVRVVYVRNPHAPKGHYPPLDPMAFVGKGAPWTFYLVKPKYPDLQCKIQPDYSCQDGNEKGTIPAYTRTPGAERDEIPALETLPCYLLVRKGLIPPPGGNSAVLDPNDGSLHLRIPVVATTKAKQ